MHVSCRDVEELDFSVIDAGNADDAVRILTDDAGISCVFADVNMPGAVQGLELAVIIKRDWPKARVIITSGQLQDLSGGLSVADRFLRKPYSFEDVSKALEICCQPPG